jgi:hypothetical protein
MKLNHVISHPVKRVFPFFSDLKNFVDAHPLLFKVEDLGSNEYLFHEKMNLFLFSHKFTYKVVLESVEQNEKVTMYSDVQRGVYLHLTFLFKEVNNETHIDEAILVKANSLVRAVFKPLLKKSHLKLVEEIKGRLHKHSNGIL